MKPTRTTLCADDYDEFDTMLADLIVIREKLTEYDREIVDDMQVRRTANRNRSITSRQFDKVLEIHFEAAKLDLLLPAQERAVVKQYHEDGYAR